MPVAEVELAVAARLWKRWLGLQPDEGGAELWELNRGSGGQGLGAEGGEMAMWTVLQDPARDAEYRSG